MACTTKSVVSQAIKRKLNVIGKQECFKVSKLCHMQKDDNPPLSHLTETMDVCSKSVKLDTSKRNNILYRNDSGYKSDESFSDEDDVISTNGISMKPLPMNYGLNSVDSQYSLTSSHLSFPHKSAYFSADARTTEVRSKCRATLSHKKPDQSNELLIQHPLQTDTESGDRFGATLVTCSHASCYQHFLVQIKMKGPAYNMRLKEDDELLLINNIFVPSKTHTDVLNLFHNVLVDGVKRLYLIIRRIESSNPTGKKKSPDWKWYESSAILSPDRKKLFPHLVNPDFKCLGNAYECDLQCKLIVSVKQEQHYLQISDIGEITTNQLKNENTTSDTVIKRIRCNPNPETGCVQVEYALSNMNKTQYVAVMPDKVNLQNEPAWCQSKRNGTRVWFKFQDVYLACDTMTGLVQANREEFFFDEYPASASLEEYPHRLYDCPDSSQECAPKYGSSFGEQPDFERDQIGSMSAATDGVYGDCSSNSDINRHDYMETS